MVGGTEMRNEVWEKVADFLQELRCSDMQRTGLVHLDNCIAEKEKLKLSKAQYVKCLDNISAQKQKIIEEYVMQLQQVAFEEQQEAYCQGIVDALQILSSLQLIPMNEKIQKLIEKLR